MDKFTKRLTRILSQV